MNDDRMPVINHLVDDLHKRLNDLENLYSTVIKIDFVYFFKYIVRFLLRFHKVQIQEI